MRKSVKLCQLRARRPFVTIKVGGPASIKKAALSLLSEQFSGLGIFDVRGMAKEERGISRLPEFVIPCSTEGRVVTVGCYCVSNDKKPNAYLGRQTEDVCPKRRLFLDMLIKSMPAKEKEFRRMFSSPSCVVMAA